MRRRKKKVHLKSDLHVFSFRVRPFFFPSTALPVVLFLHSIHTGFVAEKTALFLSLFHQIAQAFFSYPLCILYITLFPDSLTIIPIYLYGASQIYRLLYSFTYDYHTALRHLLIQWHLHRPHPTRTLPFHPNLLAWRNQSIRTTNKMILYWPTTWLQKYNSSNRQVFLNLPLSLPAREKRENVAGSRIMQPRWV